MSGSTLKDQIERLGPPTEGPHTERTQTDGCQLFLSFVYFKKCCRSSAIRLIPSKGTVETIETVTPLPLDLGKTKLLHYKNDNENKTVLKNVSLIKKALHSHEVMKTLSAFTGHWT